MSGLLQHVIVRGIEKQGIFLEGEDRKAEPATGLQSRVKIWPRLHINIHFKKEGGDVTSRANGAGATCI